MLWRLDGGVVTMDKLVREIRDYFDEREGMLIPASEDRAALLLWRALGALADAPAPQVDVEGLVAAVSDALACRCSRMDGAHYGYCHRGKALDAIRTFLARQPEPKGK